MKDTKERKQGKYSEEYSKIVNGVKVQIKEETIVGRDFEIMSFSRDYNPAVPSSTNIFMESGVTIEWNEIIRDNAKNIIDRIPHSKTF